MKRPNRANGSPRRGEPGLGPVQVLVGEEDELAEPVDQGPSAVLADGVAGDVAEQLAQQGHHDHHDHVERLLARHLPAGQDAPVDHRHLGPDGQAHGRDEAEDEDSQVAPLPQEVLEARTENRRMAQGPEYVLHVLPCFRTRSVGNG